ncbi:MAG: MIP family channel protein [Bacteroidales bacterium]|nr:MIP family channel protein [Bacteroidales bacterium]
MKTSNKFFAELFGTFVLVFGGCGTALFGHVGFLGVAIAFGLTVVAMAYGIGHISGAHLNPAVSFGVWANGRMTLKEMLCYWAAQIIGGIIAGALLLCLWKAAGMGETGVFAANGFGSDFAAATGNADYLKVSMGGAFLTECLLTFVFLMVILGVTDSRHANGKFGGLAIGLTLVLIHLISIPLTNTSVNPARSLGVALFSNCSNWSAMGQLWLFIVAPLVGAGLAGLCYKCLGGCEKCEKK